MYIHKYITIGGLGTRLKQISFLDKQNLYFQNHKIIDYIINIFPDAYIIGQKKTKSRLDTIKLIEHNENIIIIDCDVIPFNIDLSQINYDTDNVYVFESYKNKYGSVIVENNKIINYSEKNNISNIKCSGVYFIKNLKSLINKMQEPNSIVSGMINANIIVENTFKRFGDIEDYYESIGL